MFWSDVATFSKGVFQLADHSESALTGKLLEEFNLSEDIYGAPIMDGDRQASATPQAFSSISMKEKRVACGLTAIIELTSWWDALAAISPIGITRLALGSRALAQSRCRR
uniref:Uncharacterized protein n=1 Tax=Globodera rostochiensis TaxID=31243 RepID=A0A914HDI3_GLORO